MEDLKRIRRGFVEKVGLPAMKGLLDDLWQRKVLSTEDKDTVLEDQTSRADRARCLIDMVMGKGERASLAMIASILERNWELYLALGLILPPSPTDRVVFPDSITETSSAGPVLSDRQLMKVAETLGQEWEQAALQLGLETKDLDDIKAEHRPVVMQKQKMLVLWKRRRPPGEATALDLLEGLEDLEDLPVETRQLLSGQNLSDKQLLEVAQTLGQEWEQAALQLGLKTKDLDDIKAEHRSVAMQKLKMLVLWKRRRPPGKATAQDLLEGLKDLEDLPDNTPLSLSGELQRIRSEFVKRVSTSVIKDLLDDLWQQHVFSTEEKDYMMEDFRIRADRARCLIDMVIGKGERASHIMIDGMKKRDHHLCSTLGLISSPAGVGHVDDKTLVKPKEPTFFSRARDNKTRSAGRNLSDKQLRKVSEMLGQEWELVAIHLELSTTDLDVIKADRQTDVAMQKYKMLERWRGQRPPGEATAQDLLRGLEDLEDLPYETRLLLTDYWTGEELPNLLERFLNQFQRSNENESHMHAVSSSETNTPESAPQLPQATKEDEEDKPYPMDAQPKGYCLIVNNFDFSSSVRKLDQRMGTDIDEKSLRRVFTWLGFQVEVLRNQTGAQMLSSMRELANRDHSWMDCVACVVLSHGLEGGVYGVDGGVVRLEKLKWYVNGEQCRSLIGKPKLFFIQACQGNKKEQAVPVRADGPVNPKVHAQTDGPSSPGDICSNAVVASELLPSTADFLTAMATTPSHVSVRLEDKGSWFIQSLCKNLVQLVPQGKDLVSILTKVNHDVMQRSKCISGCLQMSQFTFFLRMDLVFPIPEGPFIHKVTLDNISDEALCFPDFSRSHGNQSNRIGSHIDEDLIDHPFQGLRITEDTASMPVVDRFEEDGSDSDASAEIDENDEDDEEEMHFNSFIHCEKCKAAQQYPEYGKVTPKKISKWSFQVQLEGEGTYECSATGLVFEVSEQALVRYSVLCWSKFSKFLGDSWRPAGSIYDVNVVNKDPSVLKFIHFPHSLCLTDPEHKPSFHVLHVKEQHGYIESVVDFTASHVKHRYIESAVGFTASHVKWRVSSLCPVGSIIPSSQHEEEHGAVLVYKEHDHQEQFCFHVFMASNTKSMTKAIEAQVLSSDKKMISIYKSATFSPLKEKFYQLKSNPEAEMIPLQRKFCTEAVEKKGFFEVIFDQPLTFKLFLMDQDQELWTAKITKGDWEGKKLLKPRKRTRAEQHTGQQKKSRCEVMPNNNPLLPDTNRGQALTTKQLLQVAQTLGQEWEEVAIHLDLSFQDLDVIKEGDTNNVRMIKLKMLELWKRRMIEKKREATAEDLLRGLKDMTDIPCETHNLLRGMTPPDH